MSGLLRAGRVTEWAEASVPGEMRPPFGWRVARAPMTIAFPDALPLGTLSPRLRVTVGLDLRGPVRLEALVDDEVVGVFDLQFCPVLQTHEVALSAEQGRRIGEAGVRLRVVSGPDVWFICDAAAPADLRPHLLVRHASDRVGAFLQRLASPASLEAFGWMAGCVFDGLLDLADARPGGTFATALDEQIRHYVNGDRLIYEDPRSKPGDDRIYGIEGTLPFAALAKRQPQSPLIDRMLAYLESVRVGGIMRHGSTTCEGLYTVCYPLAAVANVRNDAKLARSALEQAALHQRLLRAGKDLRLRVRDDGSFTFRNWGRAWAWFLLGSVRTIREARGVGEGNTEVETTTVDVAKLAMRHQRPDGLWSCFVDEELPPDTSASAGIAAALAIGYRVGLLEREALASANRAWDGLRSWLTPDGQLAGVAQSNRFGEALQRSGYRVMANFGAGLLGQLAAGLDEA